MNGLPEIIAREYVYITSLSDDILFIIMCMVFNFSDFIECYKIGNINKQFYRIVLNIIPTLTRINFYNTTFHTWTRTDGLEKILKETKNITTLELKKVTCNYHKLLSFLVFLKDNTPLTTCRFNNVYKYEVNKKIKNVSVITYDCLESFLTTTTYTELDFSNMGIDSNNAVTALAKYLKHNDIKLTTLDLSSNKLSIRYLTSLTKVLEINKTLTKLNLSNNSVYAGDIATVLKKNKTLTTLILSNTGIGFLDDVIPFAEALKRNTTLTTLDLSCNKIRSRMIIAIAKALEINNTLTTIDISCNHIGIGYNEAKAIAEAVKINTTLTLLDLRGCNIGADGAKAIAEALKTNTTIQIIT